MVYPVKGTVVPRNKRWSISAVMIITTVAVLALACWAVVGVTVASFPSPSAPVLKILHATEVKYETAKDVPVFVYHEMNNGCASTAPVCKAHDPETVSSAQFHAEMYYLFSHGYHTVTLGQYLAWVADGRTRLPSSPILITADNGIFSFLNGAQETLANFGFTAVAAIVTGFADAASGYCVLKIGTVNVQPGCPGANKYWDATWSQLEGFSQQGVWSFMLEAGASGHYQQDYDSACHVFDTCLLPGETVREYETRVDTEMTSGERELQSKLGSRVTAAAWVVPYSDLGYTRCAQSDCTPQDATAPRGYLVRYAAAHFQVAFVEDAFRNGTGHERFRFDVNGLDSEADFQATLQGFISAGDFDRSR